MRKAIPTVKSGLPALGWALILPEPGSPWHLSPFISADYAHVNVNGYSEKGNRSTALTFDDQTRKSRRLGAGLQGKFQITPSGTQVFAEVRLMSVSLKLRVSRK